jgi:hypothetical protein
MVVLGAEADRYRPLEKLDSIKAPHNAGYSQYEPPDLEPALDYYQVITPPLIKPLPVPSNVMAWTSLAYVIWDDVDPALLSTEQQQAMVDWLQWGGQLIISGPKSLDQLRGKNFLGPYLPAVPGDPLKITAGMLEPLSQHWMVPQGSGQPLEPVHFRRVGNQQQRANLAPGQRGLDRGRLAGDGDHGRIRVLVFSRRQRAEVEVLGELPGLLRHRHPGDQRVDALGYLSVVVAWPGRAPGTRSGGRAVASGRGRTNGH